MSSSKASSRQRSSADSPKKGGNRRPAAQGSMKATEAVTTDAGMSSGSGVASRVLLTHYPVHSLPFLEELLRPSAASRIAAVALTVHMEEKEAASAPLTASTTGNSGSDSASAALLPPPPSPLRSYAAAATAPTSAASTKIEAEAGNEGSGGGGPQVSRDSPPSTTTTTTITSASHQPTVPSLALLLECATQLSGLLAQWRACSAAERRDAWGRPPQAPPPLTPSPLSAAANMKGAAGSGPVQQQQPTRPSSERLLQLMDVILWYCLATADEVSLAYGGRSHGTSGRATPALPGTAAAANRSVGDQPTSMGGSSTPFGVRGGGGGRGGRGGSVCRSSGISSADPMGANDWLGSRMSSTAASSAAIGVPTVTMSDDQLAEHLLRPAVDAVVLLQDRAPSSPPPPASTTTPAPSGGANAKHRDSGGKGRKATESADVGKELQTVALWMLASVLVRFTGAPFNATVFLPVLFPQVDIRGESGVAARHPILQPLLRGDTPHTRQPQTKDSNSGISGNMAMRCGAAAALTALLHKLQPTLLYAEEPHPNRQAFVSLATQCGTMLLSLHESLCWGLENEGGGSAATPLLGTFATVVGATPYNRCPRSRAVILQALQLPVIRTYLAQEGCAEFVPTTTLASSVFRNESMRGAATQLLYDSISSSSSSSSHPSSNDERVKRKGGLQAAAGHAAAISADGTVETTATATAASSESFLSALLQHADTRVEVWRCMVPLSRLYPRMVHSEFDLLMSASVRVVTALTNWEAGEAAAEKAALEAKTAEEKVTGEEHGNGTPRGDQQQQQQCAGLPLSANPARVASECAIHQDPNNKSSSGNGQDDANITPAEHAVTSTTTATINASSSSLLSRLRPPPTTSPETLAECLRTWLHFMGYIWKSFDDNACDPALSPEGQRDRATLAQKRRIHAELLRPAMRLRRCGEDVRTMTLRCTAQIGDDYLSTITDRTLGEELVRYVQTCIADPQPRVRGEALTTLGMWLWQYPSMDAFACEAIDNAVHSVTVDPNALVRTKAAFALSNITGRLPEGTCPAVRDSADYIATLCATAMHAAVIDSEGGVQGHGIRMMNHLLQVLNFEELISEVVGFDEGVAEGFLRVLLQCLRAATRGANPNSSRQQHRPSADGGGGGGGASWYAAPREAKHRWNAACALGMGLAREEVFEAEPKYAVEAVDALCTAVVRDQIFKVRTQAAVALGRIPGNCLCGAYSAEDLTPKVVRSLCEALETATSTENFRQYKEQGSLHDALHGALATMFTTAKPSVALDKVFTSYQKLLQKELLL
ncbi:hypothetical protein ABB37_06395 [Leptomonas pyrrhocoris]|uniref:DUF4042 domain-containing protein n=1 Tax=Leptomonas pyrrhocoris TaxID=157538 RepID=A0A0M9FXP2_LEPPY|nr:hypothetical protein ABB37_06395 [Leptomonas pyrrhocoris]KPA78240.1 hypothetical protein ABB37_06395 [Leptomonas pyrrhocoris]|eukprot:XP_015656679.1 hypothetical protein ABB37_06395 [Leptomonas pyrrhocoris]